MKKLFLIYISILFSLSAIGQGWKPVLIDDSVQISLPPGYKKVDTLGQTIFNAETSFGNIIVTKQPDNPASTPDIEKVKHLNSYYSDFVKRISASSKGIVSNEKDTLLGKLHVKDFTLEVDSGSGKQYRNIRILHENSATYTFQFLYRDIHKDYAPEECETFFNSIRIPPEAGVKTQFTDPANTTGKPPENSTLLIAGGIAALIILIIIIIVVLRRRKH